MDIFEPTSKEICRPIPTNNVTFKTSTKHFLLCVNDANNIHMCNYFPGWARYLLNDTTQFTKFPKTTWIQTKQIACTLLTIICTIDRKFTYILHCNIHKKLKTKNFMKTEPNGVMEHLDIYGKHKMWLFSTL
jgi:hypothetical protein